MRDEKQLNSLSRFHRERELWQCEQQKLRHKAEAEMTDSNTREYIEPAKPLRYRAEAMKS
jgi:hypothetical protein